MPRRRAAAASTSPDPPKRRRYNLRITRSRRKRLLGGDQAGRRLNISEDEFFKKYNLLNAEEKPGTALKVSEVDLHFKDNRRSHHTKNYVQQDLILRRGQNFTLSVTFDRDINPKHDKIFLQLATGIKPQESKGSLIRIPIDISESKSKGCDVAKDWTAKADDVAKEVVKLTITSPADAIIGSYKLFIETNLKEDKDDVKRFEYDGKQIIMIFNPWCKEDTVYLENVEQREEYVLNQTGRIWIGSASRNYGKPWNFGQFDEPCLDAALYLMDVGELADSGRTSIISIVRVISQWANSMDEDGVLEGRWEKTYPKPCMLPWQWPGSVGILREFMKTKKPVKYGQCWVFSGLVTTLLRSVGVPTRSVTNFESAHDTDLSMTIDDHYDEEGEKVDWADNDSVWNFHVWNESWFRRPDLPEGYDGWQVHDGTPQEASEGVMRCGPASLKAIKEGHVYLNYDAGFIYAEVNGDRVKWLMKEDQSMEVMSINKFAVGKNISTKAVGSTDRHDLTLDYKYPEGSEKERQVAKFVNKFSTRRKHNIYGLECEQNIKLEFVLPCTLIGDDFETGIIISNTADEERKIRVKTMIVNAFYTGVPGRKIKSYEEEISVGPNDEYTDTIKVGHKDYETSLHPDGRFNIYLTAKDLSTGKMVASEETFELAKPDITIEMPDEITAKEETDATIRFKNTTKMKLTNGLFSVEGSGLLETEEHKTKKTVQPGEEIEITVTLKPKRGYYRKRELDVTLTFDQIANIDGSRKVKVKHPVEDSDSEDE